VDPVGHGAGADAVVEVVDGAGAVFGAGPGAGCQRQEQITVTMVERGKTAQMNADREQPPRPSAGAS
jgi:hypothetical protein